MIQESDDSRMILFKVKISNKSTKRETFTSILEIVYDENDNRRSITVPYDIECETKLALEHSFLGETIKVSEKDSVIGWIIFKFPSYLNKRKIEIYNLTIENSIQNNASEKIHLMGDVYGKNNIK